MINAVFLIGISLYVLYEAAKRLMSPPAVASGPMMAVSALGAVINLAGMLILRGAAEKSLNMKAAYFEVLSDLLTSVAVLAGGAVMLISGWYIIDPILSAAIGLFILPRTWRLLREAVGVLLEGTPSDIRVAAVRDAIAGTPGVDGVHDLHIWSLTSGMNALKRARRLRSFCRPL